MKKHIIGRLTVQELDKYLNHHQCGTATEKETSDSCDTETSSSDSDIVEEEFGSEQDSASEVYFLQGQGEGQLHGRQDTTVNNILLNR